MALTDDLDADATIATLGLVPHPEGGWFVETWRDTPEDGSRGHGTAIYFLLRAGESSHWHTVDAVEIWHHHTGGALDLRVADTDDGPVRGSARLGPGRRSAPPGTGAPRRLAGGPTGGRRGAGELHGVTGLRARGLHPRPSRLGARRGRAALTAGGDARPR